MAEQVGIEVDPWSRPADERAIIFIPGRLHPQNALQLSEPTKVCMRFIRAHHDRYAWKLPKLNAGNITDFMYYHNRCLSVYDALYQKTLGAKP